MITEAIWDVLASICAFFIGLLPSWEAPDWLAGLIVSVQQAMGQVSALGAWIAFPAISQALVFILACWTIALAIRGVRIVQSSFTGGGGSAA